MRLGWYISGVGHVALILAVLFGGLFAGDRIPEVVAVSDVSILTEEEFAALTPLGVAPDTQTDAPEVGAPEEDVAPDVPLEDARPELETPAPVDAPETPDAPEFEVEAPAPGAAVVDDAPAILTPPTDLDGSALEPDQVAAPAPRVAPVPEVAPPPEAERGPEVIEDSAPDPDALPEAPVEEERPQAPEAASDRTITEAEDNKTYAPASSKRPRARPVRQTRQAREPAETPGTDDAVADALANDNAPRDAPARRGRPLSGSEVSALRDAISGCWNVGSLSTEALQTQILVYVEMDPSGAPRMDSFRLLSFEGGSQSAADKVYRAARSALFRCGQRGLPLPPEKYDDWREIEIKFNPQGMQFR